MTNFALARRMMIEGQLRTSDVTEPRLIAAFADLPREKFAPAGKQALAYLDLDLPVRAATPDAPARCLLKPFVLGRLMAIAEVEPTDRVLDVGCATGYSTALLARLAAEVVAIEEDAGLAERARTALHDLGIDNAKVENRPLTAGAPKDAPFDLIFVNGAVEELPAALTSQLKDGGRLVCVKRTGQVANGMIYRAAAGGLSGRSMFGASAPLLPGFATPPAFVF